jgi:hypothetical protein
MNRVIWLAVLSFLGFLTLVALWYPVQRISQSADINYNEGWNTYRADMAAHGDPLYALPPQFAVTNYPPLSFHFLGFLGKRVGGFTAAGRWTALASLAFLAIVMAALVRQFAGQSRLGVYAAFLFILGLAVFVPDRIGMNDPQFLGLALSFAGLYLYARNPRSNWLLCASAITFAISLFTKHNLLAFPSAVGLHLLFQRAWKHFALWLGALAVMSGGLLFLTFWWDGPNFLAHLLAPRSYSIMSGWGRVEPYLLDFQILFAAAALWSVLYATTSTRNLLVIAFVLAHIIGFAFAGGDGVVENVLFDALVMVVVITAIGMGDLESKLISLRFGNLILLLALLIPYLGIFALLPRVLFNEHQAKQAQPALDAEFQQAAAFLQGRPGPALCEDLLLCYDAGKPPFFDAFYVNSQLKIGRLRETDVLAYIDGARLPTIEIEIPAGQPLLPVASFRFSAPVMRAILERYRPAVRNSRFTLLVPNEDAAR